MNPGAATGRRFFYWQALTMGLLIAGYSGYYLCRSNLSVAMPLLIADLSAKGIDPAIARIRLGSIASLGVLAYAIGKFPSGSAADFFGGRRNFLLGMIGSVVCTILFALGGGFPVFTIAWFGNRLVQSLGWAGVVKVTSKWFSFSSYGTVMGIISLSFLFGDAASRQFMSMLIGAGLTWRGIFFVAAGVLLALFLLNAVLLKETPLSIGAPEPQSNPLNLFGAGGEKPAPAGIKELLAPFVRSKTFWVVCLLSLGLTLVRETFNLWTPTYFTDAVGMTKADAAQKSALFPLVGGFSVLLTGYLSDLLGRKGRAAIIFGGLLLTGIVLFALSHANLRGSALLPVLLVASVGFLVIGPYAYLAGAISLDLGGKEGSGTASGLIDGVGYLGGILAGDTIARISVNFGWQVAFAVLGYGAFLTSIAAGVYLVSQIRLVKSQEQSLANHHR